jgi:hypothetical protein
LTSDDREKWNTWLHGDGTIEPNYNTTTVQVLKPTMEEGSVDWESLVSKFEWALITIE